MADQAPEQVHVLSPAQQQEAIQLLREREEQRANKRRRTEVLERNLLHLAIWGKMLPRDREDFVAMAEYFEQHGAISLRMLSEMDFMPGKRGADRPVYGLLDAQRSFARFARNASVVHSEQCARIRAFLSGLESNPEIPEGVRETAVDISESFATVAGALDASAHLPAIRMDNE